LSGHARRGAQWCVSGRCRKYLPLHRTDTDGGQAVSPLERGTGSTMSEHGAGEQPEVRRLEALWGGEFGDDYVDRNTSFAHRADFWHVMLERISPQRVLEVGCNVGGNLEWI